ncbi:MAG: hypothetical protein FWF53_08585 [Candidatus Azobacteroides sp.]|nr:hypothetical protein [Candidatus Azobacteroides sp.]
MRDDLDNPNRNGALSLENPSKEEKQLETYKAQARMYLFLHANVVKKHYASYILERLCEQNPELKELYVSGPEPNKLRNFRRVLETYRLIEEYIILYGEMLILYNPEDNEPCVVVDAYVFTDYDIEAFEERMLIEYIQNNPHNDESSPQSEFAKKAAIRVARYGAGYGLSRMGASLTHTATRLSALSNHYASGHKTLMRVERSISGKKTQREALLKLLNKSAKYGQSAAQKKVAGTVLTKLGSKLKKGTFRLITLLDVFNHLEVVDDSPNALFRVEAKHDILPKLKIYCEQNNNYQTIINRQYFENADE